MATLDPDEADILSAYEQGSLPSVASRSEPARLKEAARATSTKDRRVNIRMSSADLQDLQARALQEGMPYQTLIASVLHKDVTGHLAERQPRPAARTAPTAAVPRTDRAPRKRGN